MFSCFASGNQKSENAPIDREENNSLEEQHQNQPSVLADGFQSYNPGEIGFAYNREYANIPADFNIPVVPSNAKIIVLRDGESPPPGAVQIPLAPVGFSPIVAKQYNNSAHLTFGDVSRIIGASSDNPCDVALNAYLGYVQFPYTVSKVANSECEYMFSDCARVTIFLDKSGSLCALLDSEDNHVPRIVGMPVIMECIQRTLKEREHEAERLHAVAEAEAHLLAEHEASRLQLIAEATTASALASPKASKKKEVTKEAAKKATSPKSSSSKDPKSPAKASPKKGPAASPDKAKKSAAGSASPDKAKKTTTAGAKASPKKSAATKK